LLDITNRAKQYWNSISATRQVRIFSKYQQHLQVPFAVDELRVPPFVGHDEMGEVVDDIDTMIDWYLLTV